MPGGIGLQCGMLGYTPESECLGPALRQVLTSVPEMNVLLLFKIILLVIFIG